MSKKTRRPGRQLAKLQRQKDLAVLQLPDLQLYQPDSRPRSEPTDGAMLDALALDTLVADTAAALEAFGVSVDLQGLRNLLITTPIPDRPHLPLSGPTGDPAELLLEDGRITGIRATDAALEGLRQSRDGWWLDPHADTAELHKGTGLTGRAEISSWDTLLATEEKRALAAVSYQKDIAARRDPNTVAPAVDSNGLTEVQLLTLADAVARYGPTPS